MRIRAVLFDLYATLLEVGPPPADADHRWERLFRDALHTEPRLGRVEFYAACSQVVARHHETARRQGVPWPEIQWPVVVGEVIPAVAALSEPAREAFLLAQVEASRTITLTPETASLLRSLRGHGLTLGIVSNAQAYTWRELEGALASHDLDLTLFDRELCFLSFEHGFSKPDPHVFRILTARLEARGVAPGQILMVGDRLDNDIEPARACGWQAWHRVAGSDRDWVGLRRWLDESSNHVPRVS